MPSIRKVTGRENSLKFANSGRMSAKPALATRIFYKEFSDTSTYNVGQYPIGPPHSNTGVYERHNILIHSISVTNKDDDDKALHFWRGNTDGNRSATHANHLFSIFIPPDPDSGGILSNPLKPPHDGGNNVSIEFPLPLIVPGGCMIGIKSGGSGYNAAVEICYTVLNSTSMKGNLAYRYLSAASVATVAGHVVPKTFSANLATCETSSFSASNATMTSNPSINIDSQLINITAGRTDVQVAQQVADVTSYPNYTAKLTSNNKVTFTQKVPSDATPALTMTDATYINSTSGTHTITSPNFRGGSTPVDTVEDIEIWGGTLMNNRHVYGSESLAKSIVQNADDQTVATMVIRKSAIDAFPFPWIYIKGAPYLDGWCKRGLNDDSGHTTEAACVAAGHSWEEDPTLLQVPPWGFPTDWHFSFGMAHPGADRNKSEDTKVTMYKFPVYCKGAETGTNFKISCPSSSNVDDDDTRATWFYRPVKARGLNHGWV